jgi:TetR/AcrR family transcriptional regulator
MPRRSATKPPINTPLQKGRKATQRERLLAGMVAAANREGYSGASVSAVIAAAGVSRPTFYDYFKDRDDCFLATIVDVHERLLGDVRAGVADAPPEEAVASALRALVAFASAQPAAARFLMKEALAGGPVALGARDGGIQETAKVIEDALDTVADGVPVPDVPIAVLLGAIQRLLATRLRRGERVLSGLLEDLLEWVESYSRPAGERRWTTLSPTPAPDPSPFLPRTALRAPPALGPGRPRMAEEEVSENHRQRIMFATSQVVSERGYAAATIAEITRMAGVDGREFYRLYADKQEAFSAIHEFGFQYLMAVTAGAFFAGSSWPERMWEAYRAATQSVQENPTVANVGFVESYAVGPRGIQRVEDSRIAFTIFLQEGFRLKDSEPAPSRVALEAIVTMVFEIVYREARASAKPQTTTMLAQIMHLCLTPFMGTAAANAFIDAKLAENGKTKGPARGRVRQRAAGEKAGTKAKARTKVKTGTTSAGKAKPSRK